MMSIKTVLVIEKKPRNREQIENLIRDEGHQFLITNSGNNGLILAREKKPHLIVCNVNTLDLDGYQFLAQIRNHQYTANVPLILLNNSTEITNWRKAMEMGADDYLLEPLKAIELQKAIACQLKKQAIFENKLQNELDQLRNSISHSLPHEMRTVLTEIITSSDFLVSELNSLEPPRMSKMLGFIQKSSKRLSRIIQNYLLYIEIKLIRTNPQQAASLCNTQSYLVPEIIKHIVQQKSQQIQRQTDIQIKLLDSCIQIEKKYFIKLIEEIIDNAFKFSTVGTPISIAGKIDNHYLVLTVSNHGKGMTAEQINRVGAYMQFDRPIHEQQGCGLGLAIAKNLAELYQGYLTIESVLDRETIVKIILPIAIDVPHQDRKTSALVF